MEARGTRCEALEGKVNRVDIDEPIGAILEMFKVEMNAVRTQQKKNIRTLRGELEVSLHPQK